MIFIVFLTFLKLYISIMMIVEDYETIAKELARILREEEEIEQTTAQDKDDTADAVLDESIDLFSYCC